MTMRVDDLHFWLMRNGWTWEYTRGSHRHYRHNASGVRYHFAAHGNELRPDQVREIQRDLARLHLNRDDLSQRGA